VYLEEKGKIFFGYCIYIVPIFCDKLSFLAKMKANLKFYINRSAFLHFVIAINSRISDS
jgi:hypothetical protein